MFAGERTGDSRRLALWEAAWRAQSHARLWRHRRNRIGRRLGHQQKVARLETMPRHASLLPFFALCPQSPDHLLAIARNA